jgi:hypothetical protein
VRRVVEGHFEPRAAASWIWHRGTVPTYTVHFRYFEPEEGTTLLTKEEWERLIPEGVAASIAAWP